jgi:uncharacterized membrane protein (DUF2068 family)
MDTHSSNLLVKHFGLRGVAIFEAGKGLLAIAAAIWVITLLHKDMQDVAEHMLKLLHINPDRHLYQLLLRTVGGLTPNWLWVIVSLILGYAVIRFVEATGLWLEKEWAEWFAFISGSLYVPFEIYHLIRRPTPIKWTILTINLLIVLYLGWLLQDSLRRRKAAREAEKQAEVYADKS